MSFRSRCLTIALSAAVLTPAMATVPITKTLTLDVYVLCDDAGLNCAPTGPAGDEYFADATNKIWNQAGISVGFNFVQYINSTAFSFIDDAVPGDTFGNLHALYGTMGPSVLYVDVFFVHSVVDGAKTLFGEGWQGVGGLIMSMDDIMSFNGGLGRIDTLAHELGHNFDLVPASLGGDAGGHSGSASHLMASGDTRNVPGTLADIYPDGLALDQLPAAQVAYARQSSLLSPIPEPTAVALFVVGLFALGATQLRYRG